MISLVTFRCVAKLSDSVGDPSNKVWKAFAAEENQDDDGDNDYFVDSNIRHYRFHPPSYFPPQRTGLPDHRS